MSYLGSNANQTVELRTTRFRFTATEGQTTFSGNDANGVSLSGVDSSSHVFLNGAKLSPDGDFTTTTNVSYYDQTNYSIAFAASDDLSVSYERETSEANYVNNTTVEQESSAVQVAYTMGGMTIALSHGSHDNVGYVDAANQDQTLFAVTMAF